MSEIDRTVLAGYRLDAIVGRGGMGVVYRATQLDLGRTVALKVIAAELAEDATAKRRFLQESRLAASIDHPHVIPIYAAGEVDGVPYIAMRYVAGDDSRTLVRREGPLSPERATRIVSQIADALDAAHAAGLVHRDVKPANVLLADDDHVYLSDFGLTRHVRSISGPTDAGRWVGTLDYVAPEQIRGGHVDARTDVYALGCVLFYLLTGTVPFPRERDEARLWAHLTERPPSVGTDLPATFDAVIARALAKAPDDRYPSAGDLARAASAAATGERVIRRERAVARGDAAPVETPTQTSPPVRRRRPGVRATIALLAAIAAAAVAVIVLRPDGEAPATPVDDEAATRSAPARPRVVARIPVGARPNALARAGGRLWVGAFRSTALDAIEPSAGRRVRGVHPDVGAGIADLAVTEDQLWVATRGNQLLRLDRRRGRPVGAPVALPMTPVVLAARGDDVVAGVETDDPGLTAQLIRLDPATGAIEAAAGVSHAMAGALYARGWLWTLHGEPSFIVRRDPATLRPRERIHLPGNAVGALAYGAGALWVTIPDQDQLVRYQLATRKRAEIEVGARPVGVGVRDGTVWVAANGSSTLVQVSARTMRLVGRPVRTPLNPYTVAVGPDGVWVTCLGEDVVAHVEVPA